jgi:hypothetical protein
VIRRFALAALAAFLVLAAVILGRFAEEPFPPGYLTRPLLVAGVLALVIGAGALLARRWAVPVAASVALVLAIADLVIGLALVVIIGALVTLELVRRRGRLPSSLDGQILVATGVFFVIGLVRTVIVADLPTMAGYQAQTGGPPMIVILLDGYPRNDTLSVLGFDNAPFVDALEARGFDHYPDAHSEHTTTQKTLLAALTNQVVTDDPTNLEERRAIRHESVVPPGFVEIDPPVGFVTLGPGPHISTIGPTDLEGELIGESAVGVIAPDWAWGVLMDGLWASLAVQLDATVAADSGRVFVHLMAPHPPFMVTDDGALVAPRRCWPQCGVFVSTYERMGLSRDEWAAGMVAQVSALNARLVDAIDRVLDDHPDAVIVLFSDHGGRADLADEAELHRSFLAARTPGYPGLYTDNPLAGDVLRTLFSAYGSD